MTIAQGPTIHPTAHPTAGAMPGFATPERSHPLALPLGALAVGGTLIAVHLALPREIATLGVVALAYAFAVIAAVAAKMLGHSRRRSGVTLWDVAGALTFIGICVSALIEPGELPQLIDAQRD